MPRRVLGPRSADAGGHAGADRQAGQARPVLASLPIAARRASPGPVKRSVAQET
ncbi:hypothetical protein M2169_005038 [Streptomyces sp. MJP52]|nr:hypothetical protein [Streptomyces sp. MJP52]